MEQKSFYSGINVQSYHHYSSYSCSSSYSTLWGGIDGIDVILFQFYLLTKNVAFHLLFLYSTSSYSQKLLKGIQSKCRASVKMPLMQYTGSEILIDLISQNFRIGNFKFLRKPAVTLLPVN